MFSQRKKFGALLLITVMLLTCTLSITSLAADETEVPGKVYEFDNKSGYDFDDGSYETANGDNTYGTFYISGSLTDAGKKSEVPAYEVSDGSLSFYYNYTDALLNAGENEWHLVDNKVKKIDDITLSSSIMKGAIIIQTSKDRMNWVDDEIILNAFDDTPIRTSPVYTTTDVQLINGCYYRVVVAYKLAMKTEGDKFLGFISNTNTEYKKYAEVYEFYAYTDSGETEVVDPNKTYSLGSKVRAKNFDGYFGEELIDKDDIHYGWDLGNFFVSGYTDEVKDDDGNMVFLKNVGDKVTLWFKLNQNIDKLDNDEDLSITADTEGYDQYFETAKMDFGRGVLIIRYTDYNNVKAEPTIYTNYLEANASVGADTKVQLFEEGDYEVALDYDVTRSGIAGKTGHYRIFFKFSVRNGNCMVYPFDVETGSELTNSSMTENGFRLDLAKSRYLKINIKREILNNSAYGLMEDTRFNGPAKDGAEYTDEGIYTITVSNEYTGQLTTKKIYVGTNNILRAYMTTGLSIGEINSLIENGATISDDGTIHIPTPTPTPTPAPTPTPTPAAEETPAPTPVPTAEETAAIVPSAEPTSDEVAITEEPETSEQPTNSITDTVIIIAVVCALAAIAAIVKAKKKTPAKTPDSHHDEDGGAEK